MIIPSPRLLGVAVAMLIAAIGASIAPAMIVPLVALTSLVVLAALVDALQLWRLRSPHAERQVPQSLALGVRRDVVITIANPTAARLSLALHDHHPPELEVAGLPIALTMGPHQIVQASYPARPIQRGDAQFAPIEIRLASRLGLWQQRRRIGAPALLRVVPNFAAITKYALAATDNRLASIGVLRRQRRGEGLEFHQLREYRSGDALRSIDWKATARTRKLIAREYQEERDQTILFLIDRGRRMGARDSELSHFDHVLNAALLLAYVGLREGDAVGLLTMGSGDPIHERFLAPRKSQRAVNDILNAVYDLQPTLATSDYQRAAVELLHRVRKRALVVILTNLRDEDDDDLVPALQLLRTRHLVLLASLRERALGDALAQPIASFDDALTHAAAAEFLQRRAAAMHKLTLGGVMLLDVEPQALAVTLVNRYLEVKRSGRL